MISNPRILQIIGNTLIFYVVSKTMNKFNKINPKNIFLATGMMAVLALFLTNISALNVVLAADNRDTVFLTARMTMTQIKRHVAMALASSGVGKRTP